MMNKNITEISLMNKEYTILYSKYLLSLKMKTTNLFSGFITFGIQ